MYVRATHIGGNTGRGERHRRNVGQRGATGGGLVTFQLSFWARRPFA